MTRLRAFIPRFLKVWLRQRLDRTLATPRDLRACYRLLLARKPDGEGRRTYLDSIRAGSMTVDRLVRCFLHSEEFRLRRRSRLSGYPEPVTVCTPRFRILVSPPDSAIGQAIVSQGVYEPAVCRVLERRLAPGMTVVDVGCNIGFITLTAATRVGENGCVLAFDPNPQNCRLLERSCAENGLRNVKVWAAALADRAGTVLYEDVDGNGRIRALEPGPVGSAAWVVQARTLDDACADLARLDLMKLDTEGAEWLVVQGGRETLERFRPDVLTEFAPPALAQVSGVDGMRYLQEFVDRDYRIGVIRGDGTVESCGADAAAAVACARRYGSDHADLLLEPRERERGERA